MRDLESMGIEICRYGHNATLNALMIQPTLIDEIKSTQGDDPQLQEIRDRLKKTKETEFTIKKDGSLWFRDRLCVPDVKEIKEKILKEAHSSFYTAHPGSTKMYHDLKSTFWWINMKSDVATYVA